MTKLKAIGLMSGTSLDGIDAAVLTTDGDKYILREGFMSVPYTPGLRKQLRDCLGGTVNKAVERTMTEEHVSVVNQLLLKYNLQPADIDVIGFHGQTISHTPEKGETCQLGDGAFLAARTGIPVVNDFRSADMQAGGQGAPLAPIYHAALAVEMEKPVVFLNIGGVANVTYVGDDLIAFDTGPGNALIDDWMEEQACLSYDKEGKTARRGLADRDILAQLMAHPYFSAPPPKSLDRNDFKSDIWKNLSVDAGAATLTAFTVEVIVEAQVYFPMTPKRWIVCGGGRKNKYMMELLSRALQGEVIPIEKLGLDGDAVEAEAFAYLAVRSLKGLPLSFPLTTGVPLPTCGGVVHEVDSSYDGKAA